MAALRLALGKERSRCAALKQQLASLIAAGQADLAQRSSGTESVARLREEAALIEQAALVVRLNDAEAFIAEERCGTQEPTILI